MSKNIVTFYKLKDKLLEETSSIESWTPAQLTGSYWWDPADAASLTESSGKVSSWEDKNQGALIIQNTGSNQPTTNTRTINGLNTLDFDGSSSKMVYPGPQLSEYTKVVMVSPDTQQHNGNNLVAGVTSDPVTGAGSDALFQYYNGVTGTYRLFQDGNQPYGGIDIPINTPVMVIATADSVDSELYINGTQDVLTGSIGKVDGSGVSANGLWEIGSFYGSGYLNGQLAEILVYPTVLNEADRQSVEGYLAHKWGTTVFRRPSI